jgi:ribosomal protein L40E
VALFEGEDLLDSQQAVPVDGVATINFKWTPESSDYYPALRVVIDPDNTIKELNEKDNVADKSNIIFVGGAVADDKEGEDEDSSMMMLIIIIVIVVVVVVVVLLVVMKKKKKQPFDCPECGAMVPADATECPECGAEVTPPPETVECKKCGAEITIEDEKCTECGEPNEAYQPPEGGLTEEPAAPAAAPETPPAQPPAAAAKAPPKKAKKKKAAPAAPAAAARPAPAPAAAPPAMEDEGPEMGGLEDLDDMMGEDAEGEAECYKCGARVPLSVPKCPVCGADFE